MQILTVVKSVAGLVSSIGAGAIVTNAIKATTPLDLSTYQKLSVAAGTVVVGALVSRQATNFASEEVEKTASSLRELKNLRSPKTD